MTKDSSHNVELLTSIKSNAFRYKGHLVILSDCFGTGYDRVPGGGFEKQGGIVFYNEEVAYKLYEKLSKYFKDNKITLQKEAMSFIYRTFRDIVLKIKYRR